MAAESCGLGYDNTYMDRRGSTDRQDRSAIDRRDLSARQRLAIDHRDTDSIDKRSNELRLSANALRSYLSIYQFLENALHGGQFPHTTSSHLYALTAL